MNLHILRQRHPNTLIKTEFLHISSANPPYQIIFPFWSETWLNGLPRITDSGVCSKYTPVQLPAFPVVICFEKKNTFPKNSEIWFLLMQGKIWLLKYIRRCPKETHFEVQAGNHRTAFAPAIVLAQRTEISTEDGAQHKAKGQPKWTRDSFFTDVFIWEHHIPQSSQRENKNISTWLSISLAYQPGKNQTSLIYVYWPW